MAKKRSQAISQEMTAAQAERLINAVETLTRAYASASTTRRADSQEDYNDAAFRMFAELNEVKLPRTTQEFIRSLDETFNERGSLSAKQFQCLKDNYNKFVHNIPFTR